LCEQVSVPGKKIIYRLLGRAGFPLVDLMILGKGVHTPSNTFKSGDLWYKSRQLKKTI